MHVEIHVFDKMKAIVVLVLFLPVVYASGGCMSTYRWANCGQDEETFNLDVNAKCEKPNCTITCSSGTCEETKKPKCEIQCQDGVCNLESCPVCEIICQAPVCSGDCNVLCEATACSWKVKKPLIRPSTLCSLEIIEEPSCLYVNGANQRVNSFFYSLVSKLT